MILMVEADKLLCDLLAEHFKDTQVMTASSASEGMHLLRTHRPAVVILDPTLDHALDILHYIRSTDVPTVAIGLISALEQRKGLYELGVETIVDRKHGLHGLVGAIYGYLEAEPLTRVEEVRNATQILVVDPDIESLGLLDRTLQLWDFQVRCAKDGPEALDIIDESPNLELVLLDLRLPPPGGLEILKLIKKYNRAINVILMSSILDREVARRALELGAFDYIVKPFELDSLKDDIVACLAHGEYARRPWWKRLMQG